MTKRYYSTILVKSITPLIKHSAFVKSSFLIDYDYHRIAFHNITTGMQMHPFFSSPMSLDKPCSNFTIILSSTIDKKVIVSI